MIWIGQAMRGVLPGAPANMEGQDGTASAASYTAAEASSAAFTAPWLPALLLALPLIALLLLALALLAAWRWRRRARALDNANSLLVAQQAKMERILTEVRSERHEFLKHLRAIEQLAGQDHDGELDDVRRYIGELTADTRRIHAPLQGEKGHMAALLAHIAAEGAACGIEVRLELDAPLSAIPVSFVDQTKLAGNLLGNALEAAKRFTLEAAAAPRPGQRPAVLEISTVRRSGLYVLEVRNSTPPLPGELLDSLFRRPVATSKTDGDADRHGIGAYVVADTVRRYHGQLDFVCEAGLMTVKVKLPVVVGDEK
ncbi:two-component system, LytT family, sensor histidine kinase NatK [Paenibacillus sp. UNCCL117]|uniref:sensor histidine kinase n=1 Tax=unclassified Paenibacillus TaxID=185978 RepID=UPI0008821C55|nr:MULTISPECIES: GHKL domain-containing protein [unclassified Paenibacillus]SDD76617.1 two-component system, LytT family, sensor histidine kinase NatK [Paenibacillus sp. cl123]SFW52501.1 two-component system, LytT family, sensor histidine kinase NatK [Paenibacillus sp. UNCCL117]